MKRTGGSLGGDGYGYVYGFNGGDGFTGVHLSPKSSSCNRWLCTAFYMSIILQ